MSKPACIKDEYLAYLHSLKEISVSDARSLLLREFGIEPDTASIVMAYWIESSGQDTSYVLSGSS
jgi:hypothetical protein